MNLGPVRDGLNVGGADSKKIGCTVILIFTQLKCNFEGSLYFSPLFPNSNEGSPDREREGERESGFRTATLLQWPGPPAEWPSPPLSSKKDSEGRPKCASYGPLWKREREKRPSRALNLLFLCCRCRERGQNCWSFTALQQSGYIFQGWETHEALPASLYTFEILSRVDCATLCAASCSLAFPHVS